MAGNHIPINPVILKWARERAGYTVEQLSVTGKSGFAKFSEWETGVSYPTYSQLELIAETLHRPIALFFFPAPPIEERIEKSLRAMSEEDVETLSPGIRQLFRKAKAFQISLRELWANDTSTQENRISWIQTLRDTTVSAAKAREFLNIRLDTQQSWQGSDDALKKWRDLLAEHGIYVFKDAFKDERIAGFCIYDDVYPIIYINNSLAKTRQIFTIFHELAHLIFKQSYLDVFDQKFWRLESQDPSHIEVKCNAFAAEFLVPSSDFSRRIRGFEITDATIKQFADHYHVSREVILRRLFDHRMIDKTFYEQKVADWQEAFSQRETEGNAEGGGSYYNSKMAYLGDAYLSLVLKNYSQGRIGLEEAASHLDVKARSFPEIEERFLSRGASSVRF